MRTSLCSQKTESKNKNGLWLAICRIVSNAPKRYGFTWSFNASGVFFWIIALLQLSNCS